MLRNIEAEFAKDPFNFLKQPTISRTTHPNCNDLSRKYYEEIKSTEHFQGWMEKLTWEKVGNPYRFSLDSKISPLTMQHLYHLHLIRKNLLGDMFGPNALTPETSYTHIVEIGGGYGNLARIYGNLGYKGKYDIVDFPQMHKIQQYYLGTQSDAPKVNYISLQDLDEFKDDEDQYSLLHATFSINEMPMEDREFLEKKYDEFDALFICYNHFFDGIDNIEYFSGLVQRLRDSGKWNAWVEPDTYKNAFFLYGEKI